MDIEGLKKSIIEELPQVPYVIDQVGYGVDWVTEALEEGKAIKVLTAAVEVAKWVASISETNFYKTHLVVSYLISEIPGVLEDPKFKMYDTTSGVVADTVKALIVDTKLIQERGCFCALSTHLANLANKNEEVMALTLFNVKRDLNEVVGGISEVGVKTPITPQDYITVLGYALVLANLRLSNFNLLNYNREIINDISIILNSKVIY